MKRDIGDEKLQGAFEHLRQVPPPDSRRQAAHRAEFLARARRQAEPGGMPGRVGRWSQGLWPQTRRAGGLALAGLVATLLVLGALGGGLAYAADDAAPGEPLYGVDRALEAVRLALTVQPEAKAQIWLSLAEERLQEAEELAAEGNEEALHAALDGYGTAIGALVEGVPDPSQTEDPDLARRVGESVSGQAARLGAVLGAAVAEGARARTREQLALQDPAVCSGEQIHPVGTSLAEQYGLPYDEVMGWFCEDGYGMGEILLALETSQISGVPAGELLALRMELNGWGLVWQGLGMIGRPAAGRPGGAGLREEAGQGEQAGAPEEAGPPAEPGNKARSAVCLGAQVYPPANSLAKVYGVSYEEVMGWFCEDGFGLGDIELALKTSLATEIPPGELLALKAELGGWGLVWQELGLINQPMPGASGKPDSPGTSNPPAGGEPTGGSGTPGDGGQPSDGSGAPADGGEPGSGHPSDGSGAPEEGGGSGGNGGGRP